MRYCWKCFEAIFTDKALDNIECVIFYGLAFSFNSHPIPLLVVFIPVSGIVKCTTFYQKLALTWPPNFPASYKLLMFQIFKRSVFVLRQGIFSSLVLAAALYSSCYFIEYILLGLPITF